MFVQIVQGRTTDAEGLRRQLDRWQEEVRPGAIGFLGSTGGVADDGTVVSVARFEDEASARANSDRPEQSAWWAATEPLFDGEPAFAETSDVDLWRGGADDAGFVQVIRGRCRDQGRLRKLMAAMEQVAQARPDLIGALTAYLPGDEVAQIAWFTSEEEARRGEAAELPPEVAEAGRELDGLFEAVSYVDLRRPWMV